MTRAMTEVKLTLTDIKSPIAFADKICSQCNLCFRTPNDPEEFCWEKFVKDRMHFIEEFVLRVVFDRNKGRDVSRYRTKKVWREIFCHNKKGICTERGKCNKRRKKKCFRQFSDQVLVIDLGSDYDQPQTSKKKKKGKKGKNVPAKNDDTWDQGDVYGYGGSYDYTKDQPMMTVIGKKKFENKVEKILDEDTD